VLPIVEKPSPSATAASAANAASRPGAPDSFSQDAAGQRDLSVALKNAVRLGASLIATWAVAIGVGFLLPRALGHDRFGEYNWAESTAALVFLFAGFGVDTYIQREVSVRPEHASDFFGGVTAVRIAVMAVLLAGLYFFARRVSSNPEIHGAIVVFGLTQALMVTNASLAALLQASTKVKGLALTNVVAKLLWGVGVIAVLQGTQRYSLLALPLLASESIRSALLWPTVRRELALKLRMNSGETRAVLATCRPFFINTLSYMMGNKIDIVLLMWLSTEGEVGYYSAAQRIASLALLLAPLEGWVITPLLTRAVKRSEDEFFAILRRAIEGVLVCAIPATMMISFGAEFWMRIAVGKGFLPGSGSLQQLAPSFVFTYAAVLLATALIILKRSWTVTLISLSRIALQPLLMWLVVPYAHKRLGIGGAGVGDAFVFTFLEGYVTVMFLAFLGRRAFDRRTVRTLLKSLAALAVTYGVHRLLAAYGPWRLIADGLTYTVCAVGFGAMRIADIKWVLSLVRNRRRGGTGAGAGAGASD
jgi:O-antigen/teichoic acid export membrane protein